MVWFAASSVVTLGFAGPHGMPDAVLVLSESLLGLFEAALLITYLPAMYAAFQRREAEVTKLEVRAGSPPSGVEMLERFHRLHTIGELSEEGWLRWEDWFVDIEEVHTSLPVLNYF